jgi:hypothetical protein
MKSTNELGFQFPEILLPNANIDLKKWAVIACDQFTSQPEYWNQVRDFVKDSPSTFHMILPELYLGTEQEKERIPETKKAMDAYLQEGIFHSVHGTVLVKRTTGEKTRHGLMLALDLDAYDYNKGSTTLIRATEGTIVERLPPRIRIRTDAALELPHILVLIDDPMQSVIEPIALKNKDLKRLYDFELMLGGGHLAGYAVEDSGLLDQVSTNLSKLVVPSVFSKKYDVPVDTPILLFAMGDGNHSLATAKAIWENLRLQGSPEHPARYALVEIENIHDPGLSFEPIHRILFDIKPGFDDFLKERFGARLNLRSFDDRDSLISAVEHQDEGSHRIGMLTAGGLRLMTIHEPDLNLPVGTLQSCLDEWQLRKGAEKIDYVHGNEVVFRIGQQLGNAGFYLPGMPKTELFKTVIKEGALPRKTFSMGEANEKRYYMECRKIA